VRLTAGGRAMVGLGILFAAVAVAAAIGLPVLRGTQTDARARFERDGVSVQATVTGVTQTKGEHPRRVVSYRYSAPDSEHQGSVRLSEDDRRTIAEGDRLEIVYLRSGPDFSWIAGDGPGVMPLWLLPLVPILPLLLTGLVAWRVRRDRVLLSEGRFATARVVESKKVQHSHSHGYRVKYEFTTFSGTTVTGTVERGRSAPAAGTTVTVVYHRENPRWNAIYPLSLVAPLRD
jgi:hypothetical protein